jgi:hypothetical protein
MSPGINLFDPHINVCLFYTFLRNKNGGQRFSLFKQIKPNLALLHYALYIIYFSNTPETSTASQINCTFAGDVKLMTLYE